MSEQKQYEVTVYRKMKTMLIVFAHDNTDAVAKALSDIEEGEIDEGDQAFDWELVETRAPIHEVKQVD